MEEYLKRYLLKGEGWQKPKDVDEVFVKYDARLEDGTVVSKADRVEFTVEDGYFCPALSKSVKTMKKGEKALLTVKPQYAFGEKGRPATTSEERDVPPNASLQINLELVSWKTVSEVTNDRKVLKKTIKEGEGYQLPNDSAVVKVKLMGKLQDGTVFVKKGYDEEPFEFTIDEEQVIDGLDKAVKTMKKGEIAVVTIQPEYAFGSSESPQELAVVPGNSTVYYEVEMVSFIKDKESWEMNTQEKIEAAKAKKEQGNVLFKAGKYERASKRYEKVKANIYFFNAIEYKVHSYNRNGLCVLGFMDDHYPVRSAFSLLNQDVDEYQKLLVTHGDLLNLIVLDNGLTYLKL